MVVAGKIVFYVVVLSEFDLCGLVFAFGWGLPHGVWETPCRVYQLSIARSTALEARSLAAGVHR